MRTLLLAVAMVAFLGTVFAGEEDLTPIQESVRGNILDHLIAQVVGHSNLIEIPCQGDPREVEREVAWDRAWAESQPDEFRRDMALRILGEYDYIDMLTVTLRRCGTVATGVTTDTIMSRLNNSLGSIRSHGVLGLHFREPWRQLDDGSLMLSYSATVNWSDNQPMQVYLPVRVRIVGGVVVVEVDYYYYEHFYYKD